MTLSEKVSLLSGANFWNTVAIDRLDIPSIMLTDGPHGLRKQAGKADHLGLSASVPATCFPTAAALAASWDEQLLQRVGEAIGAEAAANQVGVLLGPGLNIVRDPLSGRAFEYFSEDPYVSGKLAAAMVRGVQSHGVAATPKHFAVNSQEHMRMSIDEVVDERTMREIYLEGFRRVVQEAAPKLIMTSYNKVNGQYANEHPHLLQDILQNEWGYSGALVTDWGGNNDPVEGVRVGGALEMPSSNGHSAALIEAAVKDGRLSENIINQRVNTLLKLVHETSAAVQTGASVSYDEHHQLAIEAAERSIVLLKNEANLLPLPQGTKVAVVGDFAKTPRYQGAGSSLVNPTRITSVVEAMGGEKRLEFIGFEAGFTRTGKANAGLRRKAVALSKKADVTVVCLGLDEAKEAEGIDRVSMTLAKNQLDTLQALLQAGAKVVVVLSAGGALEVPFADQVPALLHGSLTGQASGQALVNLLSGRVSPSGKLAVSWPLVYSDAPTAKYFPGKERTAEHREGLYVGYRYYETVKAPVRYPFGFGLTYTQFEYSNVQVGPTGVSFTVTNTGTFEAEEIAQLYVAPPQTTGVFRPVKELKGFKKVALKPQESQVIVLPFDEHSFAHFDAAKNAWVVAGGVYEIQVAASAQDVRLRTSVQVAASAADIGTYDAALFAPYFSGEVTQVSDEAYAALLGRPLPPALWDKKAPLTYEDTVAQLSYGKSITGKLFHGILKLVQRFLFAIGKPKEANNVMFIMNLPFSKFPGFTGGKISEKRVRRWFKLK